MKYISLLLVFIFSSNVFAAAFPQIYMIQSDLKNHAAPPFPYSANVPNLLYMVPWNKIEATEGTFVWTDAIAARASLPAGGKWALGVVAGVYTPSWVYTDGAASMTSIDGESQPLPWDSTFLTKWKTVITATATQFGSDSQLDHVDIMGWANTHFPSSETFVLSSTATITNITESGTTGTVTWSTPQSLIFGTVLTKGDTITISGNSVSGYNGTFTINSIASPSFTSLTFTAPSGLGTGTGGTVCDTTVSATCASDTTTWAALNYTINPLMTTSANNFGTAVAASFPWNVFAPQPQGWPAVSGQGTATQQRADLIAMAGTSTWVNNWIFEADSLTANGADPVLPQTKATYPGIRLIYQEAQAQGTNVNAAIALAATNGAYIVEIYPQDIPDVINPANGQAVVWPVFH